MTGSRLSGEPIVNVVWFAEIEIPSNFNLESILSP